MSVLRLDVVGRWGRCVKAHLLRERLLQRLQCAAERLNTPLLRIFTEFAERLALLGSTLPRDDP